MPREMFLRAADAGLCGLLVPADQGGADLDLRSLIRVVEILASADFAVTFALVVHNNHARAIATTGTRAQIDRWLPDMIAGRRIGAFLLTEPAGGSDAANITSRAEPGEDGYVLSGEKAWVTNAGHADLLNVFAQTDPARGARGIASFQVPADAAGVKRLPAYDVLGGYAMGAGGFRFEQVRVARDQMLLGPGEGFKGAMAGIDIARTVVSAMCCGLLQSCLDTVMPHLMVRQAFGKPLIEQQGLAWQMADVWTELAASRLLAAEAARRIDQDEAAVMAAAQAKKFASEAGLRGVAACMQAMGADGLKREHPFSRHLAAAKIAQYIDGTTEIQNLVLSRGLRDRYSKG